MQLIKRKVELIEEKHITIKKFGFNSAGVLSFICEDTDKEAELMINIANDDLKRLIAFLGEIKNE